ncbi:MAG: DUF1275 domain-containing protein [Ferruginibacter sp.]|nr:DUF1275 domain-containing protein [Ferruginibacter sp.]
MFRHRGKSRTLQHNLKLASLLSFVAGIVNVSGFFSIQKLTTNVTGHFAYFADEVIRGNFSEALVYLLYIFAFFFGAFASGLLVELVSKINVRFINIIPITVEIIILTSIAFFGKDAAVKNANIIACSLLFAMGLQNALVTSISNSVVRTTHLTGLFTDLGIELSQIFFYRRPDQLKRLQSSIKLRLVIISFFFLGCMAGGYTYLLYGLLSLLPAAVILVFGLMYDNLKIRMVLFKRKYIH